MHPHCPQSDGAAVNAIESLQSTNYIKVYKYME
jgi:hypothetical protein